LVKPNLHYDDHDDDHDDGNDDDYDVVAVAAPGGGDDRHHDVVGKSFELHPGHDKIIPDVEKNADKSSLHSLL
jgi:hypothetical protein